MEFGDVISELERILRAGDGRYRTAYQICRRIEAENPALWETLQAEYPAAPGHPPMGAGAGTPYSPATFVSHALNHYYQQDRPGIRKAWFDSTNVNFAGDEPGYREGWVAIWAWEQPEHASARCGLPS